MVCSARWCAVCATRRTMIQARLCTVSKKGTSVSHHASSVRRRAASRFSESSAYRRMKPSRVSGAGTGGAPTSIPNMVMNHLSSLMHW